MKPAMTLNPSRHLSYTFWAAVLLVVAANAQAQEEPKELIAVMELQPVGASEVEASALSAFYALIVQCFVHRDISIRKELFGVFGDCVVLVGGVLIILGVAMGLTGYMVDAQIPMRVLEWSEQFIGSKLLFLLCLNLFLIVVGCLMPGTRICAPPRARAP